MYFSAGLLREKILKGVGLSPGPSQGSDERRNAGCTEKRLGPRIDAGGRHSARIVFETRKFFIEIYFIKGIRPD